ncbi:hypothetical protein DSLASN_19990 [Desulfoluna limicola]|uniref:DUF3373 domain-containing protein n=1 Tax=Desulfoluna limicola TaxID=2810562 RepID=A0ABN6F506_9BACT|nr:DUF3373 family protein [Desulfoluna limicola]BCS96367.1 hypothetical protein DSLASN_19990 [Desulfoluna limicola]
MMKLWTGKPGLLTGIVLGLFLAGLVLPPGIFADESTEALKIQVEELKELVEEMGERLNKPEVHSATDKVALGVELKTTAWSLHYEDTRVAPPAMVGAFFVPYDGTPTGGFNGATLQQFQQAMANMAMGGMIPPADTYDADNDLIYTTKFRLNMNAKVNDNLSFTGRMAAYKVWGDSSGVNFNNNGMSDVTLDGTSVSRPHGDTIHLERAYFNYKNDIGVVPYNFSLGRRPSTDGPPLEYAANSLEGGSPLASIINWQFDGASLNFGLEEAIGIPGASLKLCYGVGFESDYGNSGSLSSNPQVDDVQLYGFISNFYDDDVTKVTLNYAYAPGLTDGFTGTTVMPFIVSAEDQNQDGTDEYYFTQNTGGFISRVEPSTNIGDWQAASLLFRTNLEESVGDVDLFLATSWSHTDPSKISGNPFYTLMGQGLLSSNGELESHDGYSVYAGCVLPMPLEAKLGLEYNWGSKYWFNFTGAEDSFTGSKLATRGHVVETYYIQPIMGDNLSVTVGGRYYDYEYTGSGNPLGEPVKVSEAMATDALFPVLDKAWELYVSATMKF